MRAPRVLAALALCALAASCEKIAHVDDFGQGPPEPDAAPAPYEGFCNRCAIDAASLRHPPCPSGVDGPPDDGQTYVYVWRRLRLGVNNDPAKTLDPSAYDTTVGYDLDCSAREPDGLPTRCAAQIPDSGGVAWKAYPLGIDNALAQRVLGPLNVAAAASQGDAFKPLDEIFSDQLEQGHGTVLTVVYDWNGTPDDPRVSVRTVSGFGVVGGGAPRWDGNDQWIAAAPSADPDLGNPQVPAVNSRTDDAYVSNGWLVADFSFLKPLYNHIVNNGAVVEVPLYDNHMVAQITKTALADQQFFGRWKLSDFLAQKDNIADFLAACDPVTSYILKQRIAGLATGAADLPADDALASPTAPCDAISVTWAADAERGAIAAYQPFTSGGTGCPAR